MRENIDTTSPGGRLIFHVFGALAEFEREIIRERTNAGLSAARARGKKGGRPKAMDDKKIIMARALFNDKNFCSLYINILSINILSINILNLFFKRHFIIIYNNLQCKL